MIEWLILEEGHIELVGHQTGGDMLRQLRIALNRRQLAHAAPLVGDGVFAVDPEGKGGVMVKEKRRHMVIEDGSFSE